MSLSSEVKKQILNILDDGKEHPISQIKERIRAKSDTEISEGVFAGCFRTLLLEKKCESPERGIYIKSKESVEPDDNSKKDFEEKKSSARDFSKVKTVVDRSIAKMEQEVLEVMKLYDLGNSDARLITYCLEIKKRFGEFKNDINIINRENEK